MKICNKCKISKLETDFLFRNKEKGIRKTICSSCSKEYSKYHYKHNKSKYLESAKKCNTNKRQHNRKKMLEYLKDKCCVDCGNTDIRVFDFDHKDRSNKKYIIGFILNRYKWESVLQEIEKCEIRCANCHRIKTCKQFNWFKN